jgi:hypothetical protein
VAIQSVGRTPTPVPSTPPIVVPRGHHLLSACVPVDPHAVGQREDGVGNEGRRQERARLPGRRIECEDRRQRQRDQRDLVNREARRPGRRSSGGSSDSPEGWEAARRSAEGNALRGGAGAAIEHARSGAADWRCGTRPRYPRSCRPGGRGRSFRRSLEESPDTVGQDAGENPDGESRWKVAQKGDRRGSPPGKGETVG